MKSKPVHELSWVARKRPGGVYCSAACGFGCKRSDYERAKRHADRLVKRLNLHRPNQAPWKPRVWENLGWHFQAVSASGKITVSPPGKTFDSYWVSAFLPDQFCGESEKPEVAVGLALMLAREHVDLAVTALQREGD